MRGKLNYKRRLRQSRPRYKVRLRLRSRGYTKRIKPGSGDFMRYKSRRGRLRPRRGRRLRKPSQPSPKNSKRQSKLRKLSKRPRPTTLMKRR